MRRVRYLCAALLAAASFASSAQAAVNHPFEPGFALNGLSKSGPFQGACGVARDSAGDIYVADYYRDRIAVYGPGALELLTEIDAVEPLDGPCGLAVDSAGRVYVNAYHRSVLRFTPSSFPPESTTTYGAAQAIDQGHQSTGLALDPAAGDLYVDNRTYVARYEAPITPGEEPAQKIGQATLENGYGVAVSGFPATQGYLYVPDAATDTVKAYDPATDTEAPLEEIDGAGTPKGGFNSLVDSAVAIEQSSGHLFVADNLQPGFEEPAAAIDEFNPQGAYRGQLPHAIVHSEPVGIATFPGGLYVTSGNAGLSALYAFGPASLARLLTVSESGTGEGSLKSNPAGISCPTACRAEYDVGSTVTVTATPKQGSAFAGWTGCPSPSGPGGVNCTLTMSSNQELIANFEALPLAPGALEEQGAAGGGQEATGGPLQSAASSRVARPKSPPGGAAASEVNQHGKLRVRFEGKLSPHALPREGRAPVKVSVATEVSSSDGSPPPPLKRISIAINRNGHFEAKGLPRCALEDIQPTTTADALAACRSALVGQGSFKASVGGDQQSPFPSEGKLYAFNAVVDGRPAILAHVYGTRPLPTSFTLVFELVPAKGTFGTVLSAKLPEAGAGTASITAISLQLGRSYSFKGKRRSYLSAGCPAPKGFGGAVFPFARASLAFGGGREVSQTLTRSCGVRG